MKIEDFKGKRVTVMGIGLHGGGLGAIKFFHQAGAKITATDLRTQKELKESLDALKGLDNIKYVLGQHRPEDFSEADLVIKNPGVPDDSEFLKIAKKRGIEIDTDIGIFFELCQGQIIGITGSRGKSTTASLIFQFLKTKYPNTVLAGNIRASALEKLNKIKKTTLVVLELSSWQLNGLEKHKKSPQLALITNIFPDHLNRYPSMESYIADKKLIYKFQKSKDFLILNFDDKALKSFAPEAKSKIYYFSCSAPAVDQSEEQPETQQELRIGAYLANKKIFFGANKEKITETSHVKLLGQHNLYNILAAVSVARLYDVPAKSIKKILGDFGGLEGRLQLIKEIKGIKYFNDTCSTIPEATMAAIEALFSRYSLTPKQLILIAGGADKNLDFSELAKLITEKVKTVFLLKGAGAEKFEKAIQKEILTSTKKPTIRKFNDLEKTVFAASKQAKPGDIVLLSPACASFGLFRHEFERGEKFNQAVKKL